jgi:hypothetical protein
VGASFLAVDAFENSRAERRRPWVSDQFRAHMIEGIADRDAAFPMSAVLSVRPLPPAQAPSRAASAAITAGKPLIAQFDCLASPARRYWQE